MRFRKVLARLRRGGMGRRRLAAIGAGLLLAAVAPPLARAAVSAPPIHQAGGATNAAPILFVLCDWGPGWDYQPNDLSYYQDLWTDATAAGYHSLADYYRQVSFGQTTIAGSTILDGAHSDNGWYHMSGGTNPTTLTEFSQDGGGGSSTRINKFFSCLDAASADLTPATLNSYQSVITVNPSASVTTTADVAQGATSIPVSTTSVLPPAPFYVNGFADYGETEVTAVDSATDTLTVDPTPSALGTGQGLVTDSADDFGVVGPQTYYDDNGVFSYNSGGTPVTTGIAAVGAGDASHGSQTEGVGDLAHESGHSFGYPHSRTLSRSTAEYNDCWDQMSFNACSTVGPDTEAGPAGDNATGMDAINLERQGWIPPASQYHWSGSGQDTISLHALSDPSALAGGATPLLDAHLPAQVTFPTSSTENQTSDYFTVEYRQDTAPDGTETWDHGTGDIRDADGNIVYANAVVLHLHTPTPNADGGDSYLVDADANQSPMPRLPQQGGLAPTLDDDEYADTATGTYVAVNAIDPTTWTAQVTVSSAPITTAFTYTGDQTGTDGSAVTLAGNLEVTGSAAPVANKPVTLTAGTQSCTATPDLTGAASCQVDLDQPAGSVPVTETFDGDTAEGDLNAYATTTDVQVGTLAVDKATTSAVSGGPATAVYGSTVSLAGTVTAGGSALAGAPVTLTAGTQSCQATTDGSGDATCPVTLDQAAGSVATSTAYAGDSERDAATSSAGKLTITPAPLTITATSQQKAYGASDPPLTWTAAGLVDGDTPADLGPVTCTRAAGNDAGVYPISCSGADDANYAVTYRPGDLTIARPLVAGCAAVDGDGQRVAPGTPFPTKLRVRCIDAAGDGRAGLTVSFAVQDPTGTAHLAGGGDTVTLTTGIDGSADVALDAGSASALTVTATVTDLNTVTFHEVVTAAGAMPRSSTSSSPTASVGSTPEAIGTTQAASSGPLAFTGAPSLSMVAVAVLVIDIGGLLLVLSRRRRRRT